MSHELGLERGYLERLVRRANHSYKVYSIPKRASDGRRRISHPSRDLKVAQRWLVSRLFSQLPISAAATAYRAGSDILANVERHAHNNFLLRVDFRDFFPSITAADITRLLWQNRAHLSVPIEQSDLPTVVRLVCKDERLTIGAPSSPSLSNAVMYEIDSYLEQITAEMEVTYSRYADDLYFSTIVPNVTSQVLVQLRAHLNAVESPRLEINEAKLIFTSKKRRRVITGLTVTPQGQISLGRRRKRFIRSMVFKATRGELEPQEVSYLIGFLAYAGHVEPDFITRLERRYGSEQVGLIRATGIVSRKPAP